MPHDNNTSPTDQRTEVDTAREMIAAHKVLMRLSAAELARLVEMLRHDPELDTVYATVLRILRLELQLRELGGATLEDRLHSVLAVIESRV